MVPSKRVTTEDLGVVVYGLKSVEAIKLNIIAPMPEQIALTKPPLSIELQFIKDTCYAWC